MEDRYTNRSGAEEPPDQNTRRNSTGFAGDLKGKVDSQTNPYPKADPTSYAATPTSLCHQNLKTAAGFSLGSSAGKARNFQGHKHIRGRQKRREWAKRDKKTGKKEPSNGGERTRTRRRQTYGLIFERKG